MFHYNEKTNIFMWHQIEEMLYNYPH